MPPAAAWPVLPKPLPNHDFGISTLAGMGIAKGIGMQTLYANMLRSIQVLPKSGIMPFVRCAKRTDLSPIVELHRISLPHFFWTDPAPAFLRSFYSFVLRDHEGWLFVSEHRGSLAGFVAGFANPARLFQKVAGAKLRLLFAAAACLTRHPVQLPGLLRDIRRATGLRNQFAPCGKSVCELITIAVVPQFRGQGHGKALVRALVKEATTNLMMEVHTSIDSNDKGMGYFYQMLGFERLRTCRVSDGRSIDEYVLTTQTV